MTEQPSDHEGSRKPTPGDVARLGGTAVNRGTFKVSPDDDPASRPAPADADAVSHLDDEILGSVDDADKDKDKDDADTGAGEPTPDDGPDDGEAGEPADDGEPAPATRPTGTRSTTDIVDDDAAERARPLDERLQESKERLDTLREELSDLGKKRGSTRAFGRSGGGKKVTNPDTGITYRRTFDVVQGEYNAELKKYTNLKLLADDELADLWKTEGVDDDEKKRLRSLAFRKGMMMLDEDQTQLREMTTAKLEGTKFGKFCKWLNKGGRVRRIAKHVMFAGVTIGAGLAVGAATGGVAFGAALGMGATMGLRGFRGFAASESRSGRSLGEHEHGQIQDKLESSDFGQEVMRKFEDLENGIEDVIEASTSAVADFYNDAVKQRAKKVRRGLYLAATFTVAGMGVGQILQHTGAFDKLVRSTPGIKSIRGSWADFSGRGPDAPGGPGEPPREGGLNDLPKPVETPEAIAAREFGYDANQNPFYQNKLSTHGMGPELGPNPALDAGKPGWHDLTQNRWTNSPHQFASIVHAMGLDNLPDDMQSANALAEKFKLQPALYSDYHERVMSILNDPSTKVQTGVRINYAYESEWGVDPNFERTGVRTPASDFQLAWDNYVDPNGPNGTKTVITYKDPNPPHGMKTLELREQCGGQRIKELPPPPPQPVQQYSQRQYTPVRQYDNYTPRQTIVPQRETPPSVPNPPSVPIPPIIPPINPNPPGLDKPPHLDPLPRMQLPFQGRQPGIPSLNIPSFRPPGNYSGPSLGGNSGLAPGAAPNVPRPTAPSVGGPGVISGRS